MISNAIHLSELKVGVIINASSGVRVQSSKDIPGILDAEKVNLGRSAEINFVSKAVTVLVPNSD
jgi:diacylglycerol kinase family enzyme